MFTQISDSEKDIMGSTVYCIHHKEGCKWSDQLRKLKVSYAFSYKFFCCIKLFIVKIFHPLCGAAIRRTFCLQSVFSFILYIFFFFERIRSVRNDKINIPYKKRIP